MSEWLKDVPLVWGKVIATLFFVGMIVWAWFRPRNFILKDAPDKKRWRDLRIWASILLGIQIIVYLVF